MNPPPEDSGNTAFAIGDHQTFVHHSDKQEGTGPLAPGTAHAVPVLNVLGSSGWPAEALYRGFELLVTALALIVTLPLMVIVAVLIRLDSPGSVLFFHMRPGRSVKRRGRDLEGRTHVV